MLIIKIKVIFFLKQINTLAKVLYFFYIYKYFHKKINEYAFLFIL